MQKVFKRTIRHVKQNFKLSLELAGEGQECQECRLPGLWIAADIFGTMASLSEPGRSRQAKSVPFAGRPDNPRPYSRPLLVGQDAIFVTNKLLTLIYVYLRHRSAHAMRTFPFGHAAIDVIYFGRAVGSTRQAVRLVEPNPKPRPPSAIWSRTSMCRPAPTASSGHVCCSCSGRRTNPEQDRWPGQKAIQRRGLANKLYCRVQYRWFRL